GRVGDESAGRSGQTRDEVEQQKTPATKSELDRRAEPPKSQHVERDMEDARMEEGGGDEAPPVAVCNVWPVEKELVVQRSARVVDTRALSHADQVDRDVDRHEHLRDDRTPVLEANRLSGPAVGEPHWPCGAAPRLHRRPSVIGAANADR